MLIGELAGRVGVNVQTVRYYERQGLLPAPHRWPDTGHRDYDEKAVRQMRFIRSAKAAGFTLREIRELLDMRLLPGASCGEVREMVEDKIEDLNRRLAEIKEMRRLLEQMAMACHDRPSARECPALWQLGGHR
jgi:MerR family copper efflux transcriptional regulator